MSKWTRRPDGKTIRRKSQRIQGQFAPRLIDMLESPANRVLSLAARRLLDRIDIELAHHGGLENGRLPVTYAQFTEYGIDRLGISPAIRETEALGFVSIKTIEEALQVAQEARRPKFRNRPWKTGVKRNISRPLKTGLQGQ